jgi:NAD(P)-dependent dehydrogenase (short-subunit alcohol dehydrogenase family)
VAVTSATSGIGEAMAQTFAELGATVHLVGRNPAKVKHSAGEIRGRVPSAVVIDEVCDISDLDAVRAVLAGVFVILGVVLFGIALAINRALGVTTTRITGVEKLDSGPS